VRVPVFATVAPDHGGAVVRPLGVVSEEALVEGLRARNADAIASFCERYSAHVLRVLGRLLGADRELPDLHHDVFVRALRAVHTVQDAGALKGWITTIAVNVARSVIQRRAARRWLRFLPWDEVPEPPARSGVDDVEHVEALRSAYAILDAMPTDERIAFALRIIDGMELTEVAAACGVSLATIKRRIARAEQRFVEAARQEPTLVEWLEGGDRWGAR
jgi:RNA polymerase sigma-70 factor, ECF subfamily